MGKQKSSASSATRKKHARKAAGSEVPIPIAREKKKDKKTPRQKVFIPPPKPPKAQPDPLDVLGLASKLPPSLVVVLRRFSKKDETTKRRALEELQSTWVDRAGSDSQLETVLIEALPVWLHRFPALVLHSAHQIRLLTIELHGSLMGIPTVREKMILYLHETCDPEQAQVILGSWCMTAWDTDRSISNRGRKLWESSLNSLNLKPGSLQQLLGFVAKAVIDPMSILPTPPPIPFLSPPIPAYKRQLAGQARSPLLGIAAEDENIVRPTNEGIEEQEDDRNGRLRVGALGALKWILNIDALDISDLEHLISNPKFWSMLHYAEQPPFYPDGPGLGWGQPGVRKAFWALVSTLILRWKDSIQQHLPLMSSTVLRSAWVEPDPAVRGAMWEPLLVFLTKLPEAWQLDSRLGEYDDDSDNASVDQEEHDNNITAYCEFLEFLKLGCRDSPQHGYPAVVVILSTIPSSILPLTSSAIDMLMASFWGPIQSPIFFSLEQSSNSQAFLASILESILFLADKLTRHPSGQRELTPENKKIARHMVASQYVQLWDVIITGKLPCGEAAAGTLLGKALARLGAIDLDLFNAAWDPIRVFTDLQLAPETKQADFLALFSALEPQFPLGSRPSEALRIFVEELAAVYITGLTPNENQTSSDKCSRLVVLLSRFGSIIRANRELLTRLDSLLQANLRSLIFSLPPDGTINLVTTYIDQRQDRQYSEVLWHDLLSIVGHCGLGDQHVRLIFSGLLTKVYDNTLPDWLRPRGNELDSVISRAIGTLSSDEEVEPQESDIWVNLLGKPAPFLRPAIADDLIMTLTAIIHDRTESFLREPNTPLIALKSCLAFTYALFEAHSPHVVSASFARSCLPDIYILAYVLPACDDAGVSDIYSLASKVWTHWMVFSRVDIVDEIVKLIRDSMQDLLTDIQVRPSHHMVVNAAMALDASRAENTILSAVILGQDTLNEMYNNLPPLPFHPGMILFYPSMSMDPQVDIKQRTLVSRYDRQGFSRYGRAADALMQVLVSDRPLAKNNLWALRYVLALALYANQYSALPTASNPIFGPAINLDEVTRISRMAKELEAYLLSFVADNEWHKTLVTFLQEQPSGGSGQGSPTVEEHAVFITQVYSTSFVRDHRREVLILQSVLESILSNTTRQDSDLWLSLAQTIEHKAPQTSLAILRAIIKQAPEPTRLDRYRSDLASRLSGVPPTKANTEGLRLLRQLNATAPLAQAEVVFLPQQRAVFLIQALQKWISSDEDLDEEIDFQLTSLFIQLVPIILNVPGAHWDLIFDLLETSLENCALKDDDSLALLGRTLNLIIVIMDLESANVSLHASWQQRCNLLLTLVRDMVISPLDDLPYSAPRIYCRTEVMKIVGQIPSVLIIRSSLPNMCHLLKVSDTTVQLTTYQVLQEAAKKQTEFYVMEAAVDSENVSKFEIPPELIQLLQNSSDIIAGLEDSDNISPVKVIFDGVLADEFRQGMLGQLLAWMLIFDLFEDASIKVRAGYIEHIRNSEIIGSHFLPLIFGLLDLSNSGRKPCKLDGWSVNWFSVPDFEHDSFSLSLLAAHLYYRSLVVAPSLIRNWWLECKDRQFSNAMAVYTSTYFSQVIVQDELALVKDPSTAGDLQDGSLVVKVAFAVGEVSAIYTIDEQQMEIGIKMPPDFPLHGIEVKDVKRLGVDERRWRGWLLSVQQVIAQNGRIVDGLLLFKRNVKLHFEGQVECAICYSIISVSDQSLPTKPCKTCKNRFHASCLFKWFKSSHHSSCPLCRSDML